MDDFYVYRWFHLESGKSYVGKGRNGRATAHVREVGYGSTACPKFYKAVRKYGWGAFSWQYLAQGLEESLAFELEKTAIAAFDSQARGYNLTSGGEGATHAPESIAKMKLRRRTPEAIAKTTAIHLGRKHRSDSRKKMSEAHHSLTADQRANVVFLRIFGAKRLHIARWFGTSSATIYRCLRAAL